MKAIKMIISLLMAIFLLSSSTVPIFAVDKGDTIKTEDKISETLKEIFKETDREDSIPVYVWYQDIDQNEIDERVFQETGLTPQTCDIIPSISLDSLSSNDTEVSDFVSDYIGITESQRKTEKELVSKYNMSRQILASEEYAKKSQVLISNTVLGEDNVKFISSLAPMIIADLTQNEILSLANNPLVDSISYNNELLMEEEEQAYTENYSNGAFPDRDPEMVFDSLGLSDYYDKFSFDGSNIKIGLVEGNVPGIQVSDESTYDTFGFSSDNLLQVTYDPHTELNSINSIVESAINNSSNAESIKIIDLVENGNSSYLAPDPVGIDTHSHANNSSSVMLGDHIGIAKGALIYATLIGQGHISSAEYIKYANTEALVKCGINILITNIEVPTNHDFSIDSINNEIKYNEHLVYSHNITVVIPGGNRCYDPVYQNPEWINLAAFPYNAITVSGYDVVYEDGEFKKTRLNYKWRNCDEEMNKYACEKPDVIYPACYSAGGTSVAAPAMAATIALMMDMKPALQLQPQAVKSIILASCHNKADPATSTEEQETMTSGISGREHTGSHSGITEKQGAGIPDVMKIADIICQHTYGVNELVAVDKTTNIIQPPYGAENINFSLSWLRGTSASNNHLYDQDITLHDTYDLQLKILKNDMIIAKSDLIYSSTELCYVPTSDTNDPYGINVSRPSSGGQVRFGYAWSTDSRNDASLTNEGIYYIRNSVSNKYLVYDYSLNDTNLQIKTENVTNQSALCQDNYKWILNSYSNEFSLGCGYGTTPDFLSISNIVENNMLRTDVSSTEYQVDLVENSNGTFSIFNSDHSKILFGKNNYPVWASYDGIRSIRAKEKWFVDKNNYLLKDSNADGSINNLDVLFIQRVLVDLQTPTNIQSFLGDVDKSGELDIIDATIINWYLNS